MKFVEEVVVGGKRVTFEAGQVARQAHGAVVVRHEGSMVLATVVVEDGPARPPRYGGSHDEFVPLTVEYRERMSASGRIPGGYGKREARIGDHEVLTSRLIDRTLRPLFPKGFASEVQVLVTAFGADPKSDLESLALLAAAAALHVSQLPVEVVAGLRIARIGERTVLMPSEPERDAADLEWAVAATRAGFVMVEGGATGASEEAVLASLGEANGELAQVFAAFDRLRVAAGRDKIAFVPAAGPSAADVAAVDAAYLARMQAAYLAPKTERRQVLAAIASEAGEALQPAVDARWRQLVRERSAAGERIGGRGLEDVRDIMSEVGYLPSNHGSALFTRGETQALVSVTLGATDESLVYETVLGRKNERFFLHYNFPPFSVGEVKASRGPGRREVGHGALARRALDAVMPAAEDLAFTVRVVSDILESNGSSSMATVCGASLALMDAAVPITAPVAGIAMGLVSDGDVFAVLSDITGDEDQLGDMDFKVAATRDGITALQLDIKVGALTLELLGAALAQARRGIAHILEQMATTLAEPRAIVPAHAPQVVQLKIPPGRVGTLIGQGGKTVQEIQSTTNTRIDVKDDGRVRVSARKAGDLKAAIARIEALTLELKVGATYQAEVVTLKEYGAFVRIGEHEGLVHISELAPTRVEKVEDVLKIGEVITVKVIGADKRGRLELSRKAAQA